MRLAIVRDQLAAMRDQSVQISSDDIFSSDGRSTLQDFYELLVPGLLAFGFNFAVSFGLAAAFVALKRA